MESQSRGTDGHGGLGKMSRCAAAGPFPGARVHTWVSAPPSNGPTSVPLARVRSEVARQRGLASGRVSWPLGVHAVRRRWWQREVESGRIHTPDHPFLSVDLGLGFELFCFFWFASNLFVPFFSQTRSTT
jgi:hypothetical protein